ncbi:hypothetical protein LSH36_1157g00005 [Paralvinella palmiformis]|uniref:Monocarboxylate transporter n=1 Tax=Paralvinella palmiformis TaxID=53620 RepID=A0AAD9IVP3_9ANNE|nr:hypothetical protein LSH36_1157g00005 [Paralvinella palmiformis]
MATNGEETCDVDGEVMTKKKRPTVYGTVDTGWAWMVMTALFVWNTLLAGTMKSFGVIYLEFLELYQRGPVATAWMGCTFSLVLTLMGWQSNLELAVVAYGFAGLAASLVDTPILSLIGKYFKRRRFLASGIVFSGSSFGTLVLPPIFTILVDMYTIRGAMLVFGGVWLNVLLVGAVIRPIKESSTRTDLISSTETPDLENIEIGASEETEPKASRQTSKHLLNANDNLNFELRHSTLSLGLQPLGINTFMASSRQSLDRILAGGRLQRHRYNISAPCLPLASNFGKVIADPSDSTTTDANEDTSHPEQDQHEDRAPDERLAGVTSKVVVGCCELVHEAFVLS